MFVLNPLYAKQESPAVQYLCKEGQRYYEKGRIKDAFEAFRNVLAIEPNNPIAQNYLQQIHENVDAPGHRIDSSELMPSSIKRPSAAPSSLPKGRATQVPKVISSASPASRQTAVNTQNQTPPAPQPSIPKKQARQIALLEKQITLKKKESEIAALHNEVNSLKHKFTRESDVYQDKIKFLKVEITDKSQQLYRVQELMEDQGKQLSFNTSQLDQKEQQIQKFKNMADDLQGKLEKEVKQHQNKTLIWEDTLAIAKKQLADFENTLSAKEVEITRLNETVAFSQDQLKEKQHLAREKEELKIQVDSLQQEIESLKKEIERKEKDGNDLLEEYRTMEEILNGKDRYINNLKEKCAQTIKQLFQEASCPSF